MPKLPKRILVIANATSPLRGFLQTGYEVVFVDHGVAAIHDMRHTRPELILIDQDVPIGGMRTARIIRLNKEHGTIPMIIAIPGEKNQALLLLKQGREAGLKHIIVKPFDPSLLAERVAQALRMKDREDKQLDIAQIKKEIQSLSDLPAMPEIHGKILVIIGKPDTEVDVDRLVRLIEADPFLVANILKIARSACYGFGGSYVRNAVTFLGLKRLRPIIHAASVLKIFEKEEGPGTVGAFSVRELWRHSLACGVVMGIVSREVRGRAHFLLGLLHDIGKIVLNHKFHEYFKEVVRIVDEEKRSIYDVEKEILGITHADIGHVLASVWELPPEVVVAIAHHHRPSTAQMHKRLGALVHFSDIAVRTMQIGYGGDPLIPEMDPYANRLRLKMDSLVSRKEEIIEQVDSIASIREENKK